MKYPDDPYDRIWSGFIGLFPVINTTRKVEVGARDPFQAPLKVLETASSFGFSDVGFILLHASPGERIYIVIHFAELRKLLSNESRVMNIYQVYDPPLFENYSPPYLKADHLEIKDVTESFGFYYMIIRCANSSTLGSIINGVESYTVKLMNESETDVRDGENPQRVITPYLGNTSSKLLNSSNF